MTDAAQLETKIGSAFGLPSDVYVVLAEGPQLEPLLQTNERLARRGSRRSCRAWRFSRRRGFCRRRPRRRARRRAIAQRRGCRPATVRAALERARVAGGFTPGAFDPFAARLPRLLDPSERLSYDGYVAHGLGDLIDRFVVRDGDRWTLATYVFPSSADQAARVQAIVDAVDPSQTLTGLAARQPRAGAAFSPAVHQGPGDRHA